jgi:hypothetical protein
MQSQKHLFLLFFILVLNFSCKNIFAQETENPLPPTRTLGVGLSFGESFMINIDASKVYGVTKNKKFRIGYGIRYSGVISKNQEFVTAPANITSGQTGLGVLFAENKKENFDTLSFADTQTNAINVAIYLQYAFNKKWDIGFNIDAIGFSFGGKQIGIFEANGLKTTQNASPTAFNLLLISDNDLGSLNSEIYARYWLTEKWAVKAGFSFMFTEYKTDKKLTFDNDRFRNKALLFEVGGHLKF